MSLSAFQGARHYFQKRFEANDRFGVILVDFGHIRCMSGLGVISGNAGSLLMASPQA